MVIRWSGAKESKLGCGSINCLSRKAIKEVGGGVKALCLVARRDRGLEEQGVHDVVSGTNHMLSLAILGRSVRTGYPELYAMGEEERPRGVIKLSIVVALDSLNGVTNFVETQAKKCFRVENVSDFKRKGKVHE